MTRIFKRILCLFKGHKWNFWSLVDNEESCEYENCGRCGKMKNDTGLAKWLNEEIIENDMHQAKAENILGHPINEMRWRQWQL